MRGDLNFLLGVTACLSKTDSAHPISAPGVRVTIIIIIDDDMILRKEHSLTKSFGDYLKWILYA